VSPAGLNLQCDRKSPLVEGQSDGNGPRVRTSVVEAGATRFPWPKGRRDKWVTTLPFGLPVNGSMNWCLRSSDDLDMEEDEVDIEGPSQSPCPWTRTDESEPRLVGVLVRHQPSTHHSPTIFHGQSAGPLSHQHDHMRSMRGCDCMGRW